MYAFKLFVLSFFFDYCVVLHDLHLIHTDLKPENILLVVNDHKTMQITVPGKVCKTKPDVIYI
jgi:serine/threonine protein kinase